MAGKSNFSSGFEAYRKRQHATGPGGGGPKATSPRAAAHRRADTASYKARLATDTASSSGDAADHRKAAAAHKVAAATNRNAGNSVEAHMHDRQAEAHQASVKAYQASGTKAVYNGSPSANRKAAALHQVALNKHAALGNHDAASGHEHAGQEHSNSFGTDPATGNAQSKAQVSGPGVKGYERTMTTTRASASPNSDARAHEKALAHVNHAGVKADAASAKANAASAKAQQSGAASDHAAAQKAHQQARTLHAKAIAGGVHGNSFKAYETTEGMRHAQASSDHAIKGVEHGVIAREGGRATLNHGVQTGGGANNASRVSVHPKLLGVSLHGKPSAGAINLPAESSARAHIAERRTYGKLPAGPGSATHVPGAQEASVHAVAQSAKANAKPSLVSHSLAAKAHTQAAASHAHQASEYKQAGMHSNVSYHETLATQHTAKAADHKLLAAQHSQRIMKLKKLGPGQHHGAKGQFTGTPGGAK